jgi:hypothetical protein
MSFTWSFSSLKQYVNCPKQYQEVKVLKRFHIKPTAQMTYGNEVHKACEDYVGEGKPLAKNYQQFKPVLDTLMEIEGTRYPEQRMALDFDGNACEYGKGYWVRGIVDLMIIDGDTAFIVDYKTGSNKYPDPKQLKLMALMAFAHYPQIKRIKAGLLFVVHNSFLTEEYVRDDVPKLWDAFSPDSEPSRRIVYKRCLEPQPNPALRLVSRNNLQPLQGRKMTIIDYAYPMMAAEKALRDAHDRMLEKKYDEALEEMNKVLVEARITINSIRHMKEQDNALRQQTPPV